MVQKSNPNFLGTYFQKDVVIKLSLIARIFAWIIASFYALQWILQLTTFIMQIARGSWMGIGFIDITQNLLWLLEQPLRGLVYFAVLQGAAQVLLILMDIEDNTRCLKRE